MLSDDQREILLRTADQTFRVLQRFHSGQNTAVQVTALGDQVHAFYSELTAAGLEIEFSEVMLANRQVPPSNPEFFRNTDAITEFVGILNRLSAG